MDQNLSLYRIFYTVATQGNFSKAASILYISQPAISKAIKNLESNLLTTLFTRNSRGVVLTEEGRILYEHIALAFNHIDTAENAIKNFNELGLGSIHISVSSTLCKYILLPYLKKYIKKYPHVKITIECRSTTDSLSLLKDGKTYVGLIGRTDNLNSIDFYSLGNINYIFVATKSYINNLSMRGSINGNDIFKNANLMMLDKENVSRQHVDNYLNQYAIEAANILEVNNMDLLIDFAKIDMGIACVIKDFVEKDLASGSLCEIPLITPIKPREIGFAYNEKAALPKAVQNFIELYKR